MYKQDLTLNNLKGLICHKNQLTSQPTLLVNVLNPTLL